MANETAEILSSAAELINALKSVKQKSDTPEDRKAILRLTIEELRHTYDWVDAAFVRMRTKSLTFIGGGLTALAFLYADGDTFIPSDTSGKIFYFVGFGLLTAAIATLLVVLLRNMSKEFSIEDSDIEAIRFPNNKDFLASEEAYLQYVKERYYKAYRMNREVYEYCCKWQQRAFLPFLAGAIILAVLKIFGA